MKLPDGTTLMHGKSAYDPAKARAYYLRTRRLIGRQKGTAPPPKAADQAHYRKSLEGFLKKLPMAVEGADLKTTEKFVDSMRGKTDAQLKAEAKNMKDTPGHKDASIKAATIQALLDNRSRIRGKTADAKKIANKNDVMKKQKLTKTG